MNKNISYLIGFLLSVLVAVGGVYAAEEKKDDALMAFFGSADKVEFKAPEPLLSNVYGRDRQSLNGAWDIVVDEPGMGLRVIKTGMYLSAEKPAKTGMELIESSFDSRTQLQVPGDWNSQVPELDRYRGKIIYHKVVDTSKARNKRYFLHFGAINYKAEVFLNGQFVGRHEGGYTTFNFDVTDTLKSGKNTVFVRVDAFLDDSDIPTMRTSDFWKYGGISRDVSLVSVPATYIGQYHSYLSNLETREITTWVQLQGDKAINKKVKLEIPKAGISVSGKTDKAGRVAFVVNAQDLALWSPASPVLYDVKVSVGKSSINDSIGFRTITTDGTEILLNDKPVQMYGISMHEETILRRGLANSRADAKASLGLVKELGANFVRLAHYPHNEHTLRLADELGLMVWSEIPIVSSIDWTNEHTRTIAQTQIAENVSRDLNRASIVMWSVSNETFPKTDARLSFLKSLADIARDLDDSDRPIASALIGNFAEEFGAISDRVIVMLADHPDIDKAKRKELKEKAKQAIAAGHHQGELHVAIDDPLGDVVDIVGYNEYFGWYYSMFFSQMLVWTKA